MLKYCEMGEGQILHTFCISPLLDSTPRNSMCPEETEEIAKKGRRKE